MERHLNLNGYDTSLIWTYFILSWGISVVFIAKALRYMPRVRVIPHSYSTGNYSKRVTRVSQFTTAEQKKNVRSKGSESGKRCTHACTSHVASGVENGQVVLPFVECGTLSYFRRYASSSLALLRAYVASWLAAFRAFRSHVLFHVLHRYEMRTTCNLPCIVASAVHGNTCA